MSFPAVKELCAQVNSAKAVYFFVSLTPIKYNSSENKKFVHHPQVMGYVCPNFCISTIRGFCRSAGKRMRSFLRFFANFAAIKKLSSKKPSARCAHHPRTMCRLCAKSGVLRKRERKFIFHIATTLE